MTAIQNSTVVLNEVGWACVGVVVKNGGRNIGELSVSIEVAMEGLQAALTRGLYLAN